jgi:RHS repeat-associated protein
VTTVVLYPGADAVRKPYQPVEEYLMGQTSYYHFDGLGSTQLLTDENANITDSYCNTAFGSPVDTGAANPTVNPFRFVGQLGYYLDPDTGSYYVRARTLSPVLARWLSEDPIGFAGGDVNLYRYVGNRPTYAMDATGLAAVAGFLLGRWCPNSYIDITTLGGKHYTPTTSKELVDTLNTIKNGGDTIDYMIIKGHGATNLIDLPDGGTLQANDASITVESTVTGKARVTAVLRSITGSKSTISLRGCFTQPLAVGIEATLNNHTTVSGSCGVTLGIPWTCQSWGIYSW